MFEHRPFGNQLKLSIRGASHAPCLEFSLSGFPRGFRVDEAALAAFMERRAPGRDALSTARNEADKVVFVSGLADGVTTGETIVGRIANTDCRPHDYGSERTIPRPGHADFGQWIEYGRIPSGGGANSGRLTAAICGAGALCLQWLKSRGIEVRANVDAESFPRQEIETTILAAKSVGDSVGGLVRCAVTGVPAGVGGALFAGMETELAGAVFGIPGVKGIEFGNGFAAADLRGSENNDAFTVDANGVRTETNRHGGILGGRTSGMPIEFSVAFKPTPTIFKSQPSVDLATMQPAACEMKGRHDPCIVRRAVPVVEAVTAFVIADQLLMREAVLPRICLTLTGATIDEDLAQYRSQRYFCDLVELRADLLTAEERVCASEFPSLVPVPVILTYRRKSDGGAFDGDEAERIAFFMETLVGEVCHPRNPTIQQSNNPTIFPGFAYVDFEEDFHHAGLEALARSRGTRIVRSMHCFDGPVADVPAKCRELVGDTDEIAKIAFMPKSLEDVSRLFAETRDFTDVPHIVCAMGALGLSSRVLAGRTHSLWTYASVGGLDDLGHITPHELVRNYRFRMPSSGAELFGVTGFPLKATRSPEINNIAWANEDREALMAAYPSASAEEALAFMKAMGMRGLAVTIPHKQTILPLLDRIDPSAARVGAVNTVSFENGEYVGYNTDVAGFAEAIRAFVEGCGVVSADAEGIPRLRDAEGIPRLQVAEGIPRLRAAVLGDGGAAQAVKAALESLGVTFEVFHRRTPEHDFDLIVNATPVDPIPDYVFSGSELVYDLRYVPAVTPLMARAQAAGCKTENGFSMLQAQAREQRRVWRT